ncbi:MAG: YtxH domain-containing protein [Bryobacterales bacterium]|nr:YtxH domain-containing protein [Bryobacterales bacterium]
MEDQDNSRVVWFLAGAAIGATVALLFAPQSGEETRRRIRVKANEGREALGETGRDLAGKSRELFEKGKRLADEAADMFDRGRRMAQG